MSVKIGSLDLSDVVVGEAGGGKTNIDKIVVGNADGTGTVLWQRTPPGPTIGGVWRGVILNNAVTSCEFPGGEQFWIITTVEANKFELYFTSTDWHIYNMDTYESFFVCYGDGTEKRLVNAEYGINLTWSET